MGESTSSGSGGQLSRRDQKARTRRKLLDATIQVVAREGYEGATLAEMARLAGYTTGAMQAHFGTKANAVSEALRWRIEEAVPPMLLEPDANDPVGGIIRGFRAWLAPEHAGARSVLAEAVAEARRDPVLASVADEIYSERNRRIRKAVALAIEQDRLDAALDADSLGFLVAALYPALAAQRFVGMPAPDMDRLLDTLNACLTHGASD